MRHRFGLNVALNIASAAAAGFLALYAASDFAEIRFRDGHLIGAEILRLPWRITAHALAAASAATLLLTCTRGGRHRLWAVPLIGVAIAIEWPSFGGSWSQTELVERTTIGGSEYAVIGTQSHWFDGGNVAWYLVAPLGTGMLWEDARPIGDSPHWHYVVRPAGAHDAEPPMLREDAGEGIVFAFRNICVLRYAPTTHRFVDGQSLGSQGVFFLVDATSALDADDLDYIRRIVQQGGLDGFVAPTRESVEEDARSHPNPRVRDAAAMLLRLDDEYRRAHPR